MKKDIPPTSSERLEVPEKAIRKLSELLRASDLSEIEICEGDFKIRVRAKSDSVDLPVSYSVASRPPSAAPAALTASSSKPETNPDGGLHWVRSPFVGTFYKAPSPDAEPFVREGQSISKGQVLCIVEAMKVMNEIESDVSGVIEKVNSDNGLPVDFNAALFGIRVSS